MAGKELLPVTVLDAPVVLAKSPGDFHLRVTGMLVRKFQSNRLLPLREIYVGSVNGQIQ